MPWDGRGLFRTFLPGKELVSQGFAQNKENAEQAAWKQELERDEAKFGEDIGEPLYPPAPKNRGYPGLRGKSE